MHLRRHIFLWASVAAGAFATTSASAVDILVLSNGDRLSGKWIETTDGVIVFESSVLGVLKVAATEASVVDDEEAEAEVAGTTSEPPSEAPANPEPSARQKPDKDVAPSIPPPFGRPVFATWQRFWEKNPVFAFLAKYYPLIAWDNKFEFGFDLEMGESDTRKYLLRFSTQEEWEKSNLLFEASYEYSDSMNDDGVRTTTRDRLRSRLRYRYDFRKAFFVESETRYRRNLVQKVYHELGQTIGIGYRVFDTDKLKLSLTPSVGAAYQDIEGTDTDYGYLAVFSQDLNYALTDRIKIAQESSVTFQPTEENDNAYLADFNAKLTNMLNQRLSLNLRYEINYDGRVKDSIEKTSQTVSISLGANF